ncbi:flowering-promoting factor 1-like protein 2 [Cucurbita pepo subsp. pepo]|uniref:flowering-promoting factor 1-like protein 2 n=1 Tax=Cucurbita pepo subsp. pepo TaxID=3664 RepID=UPI000C9D3EB3|nr:flowering-promoting factor 1-like protein 2 [Cucurbita pepo subsp. pepo]
MSGVWVFRSNGVIRLVENSQAGAGTGTGTGADYSSSGSGGGRKKVLVHLPSGQPVCSYGFLEKILEGLGWERYYEGDPDLFQFHKLSSIDLISLPMEFSKFNSVYMYDLVVKNPNVFHVREP